MPAEEQVVAGLSLQLGQEQQQEPHQESLQSVLGVVGPCLPLSTLQELVGRLCFPTLLDNTMKAREKK